MKAIRIFAYLLCAILLIACLAGCTPDKQEQTGSSADPANTGAVDNTAGKPDPGSDQNGTAPAGTTENGNQGQSPDATPSTPSDTADQGGLPVEDSVVETVGGNVGVGGN